MPPIVVITIDNIHPHEIKYAQTNANPIVNSAIASTVINVGLFHHLIQVIRNVIFQDNL